MTLEEEEQLRTGKVPAPAPIPASSIGVTAQPLSSRAVPTSAAATTPVAPAPVPLQPRLTTLDGSKIDPQSTSTTPLTQPAYGYTDAQGIPRAWQPYTDPTTGKVHGSAIENYNNLTPEQRLVLGTYRDPGGDYTTTNPGRVDAFGTTGLTPEQITTAINTTGVQASGKNPSLTAVGSYVPNQVLVKKDDHGIFGQTTNTTWSPNDINQELTLSGQKGGLLAQGEVVGIGGRIFNLSSGRGYWDTGEKLSDRAEKMTGQINAGDVNKGGKLDPEARAKLETQAVGRLQDSMFTDITDPLTREAAGMIPGVIDKNSQRIQTLMDTNAGLQSAQAGQDYWGDDRLLSAAQLGNVGQYQQIADGRNLVSSREAALASARARNQAMSAAVSGIGGPMAAMNAGMANAKLQGDIAADAAIAGQKERNAALEGVQRGLDISRGQGLTQSEQAIGRDKSLDQFTMDKYGNMERATGAANATDLAGIDLRTTIGGNIFQQEQTEAGRKDQLATVAHSIVNNQRLEPGMLEKFAPQLLAMGGAVANATSNLLGKAATAGADIVRSA